MNTKKKAIIGGIIACFILVTTTAIAMPTSEERIIEDGNLRFPAFYLKTMEKSEGFPPKLFIIH